MPPYPTPKVFETLDWNEKEGLVECLMVRTGVRKWSGEKWRYGGMDRTYKDLYEIYNS